MIIKGNSNNDTTENKTFNPYEVNQEDIQFITLIQNRITGYGQIPYTVPTNLIVDVIKSSAKFFYHWYPLALHHSYYAVKTKSLVIVNDFEQLNKNSIKINPRIKVINKIYESMSHRSKSDDFNAYDTQSTISGSALSTNGTGIDNNMFMIENAVRMVELSALRQMFKTTVSFRFNMYTHELILKRIPSVGTIVLDCSVCNDITALYEDIYFERHVIANVKRELKRIIGTHTIPLPGGAILNVEELCNNIEDAENIEDKVRAMNSMGDIISTR